MPPGNPSTERTCHHCGTAVTEGLSCPACGAFVPDLPPELLDGPVSDAPVYPTWAVTDRADDGPDPDRAGRAPAGMPAPDPDAPLALGPASDDRLDPPPPPPGVPPGAAFPAWAVRDEPPTTGPTGPTGPTGSTSGSPSGSPTESLAARLGRPSAAPRAAAPGSGSRAPVLVAAAVAAAIVILVVAGLVLTRPRGDAVADDIAGTCFRYGAGRTRVDRVVPCNEVHEGKVLASVADRGSCPAGTTAVLTKEQDAKGTDGVLCVAEPG